MDGWVIQDRWFADAAAALDWELAALVHAGAGVPHLLFWELDRYAVVLGYGRPERADVDVSACVRDQVPVLRRRSGGGTVLLGPGCLCYCLALPAAGADHWADITRTNQWVLSRVSHALAQCSGAAVSVAGISDLVVGPHKVGGSAQRRTRDAVLWHGTLLYNFALPRISQYLSEPDRQPEYRQHRPHAAFVANLPMERGQAIRTLTQAFDAAGPNAPG